MNEPPAKINDLQQKQQAFRDLKLEDLDKLEDSSWVSKFDPSKKKKKKKKPLLRGEDADNAPHCQSGIRLRLGLDFEPDYDYKQLLSRVIHMLRDDDLEVSTESPRTVTTLPLLQALGTHTTVCLNFAHLCRTMHRKPEHVMRFLLAQLETRGFLNKQQRLEMNCFVSTNDFQAVFRRYIDAFVICSCCKSPDTALAEDNGVFTLRCVMCGVVASIKEPNPVNNSLLGDDVQGL